jgi:CPA2 family monovalent cation:H+ antiporter-2
MDPIMPALVGSVAGILLLGLVLRALKQPSVVAYLMAGLVLGPAGLGLMTDQVTIARLGEIGVILLLFFVGMEISLPALVAKWRVPVVGTLLQIAVSVGCLAALGGWQGWAFSRSLLLGFVISLSSTAVVIKLLQSKGEIDHPVGRDVIGILLMQDLAIVPMLIIVGLMGGVTPGTGVMAMQLTGGAIVIGILVYIAQRPQLHLPLGKWLRGDPELQVFAGSFLCFGLALLTGFAGLSAAVGAFIGGIVVGAARETKWIHESLFSFRVLLLALFFVSVGMLIEPQFLWDNLGMILVLLAAILLTNTILNMLILRALGRSWRDSLYGGATLAQIGEFSFVLAAVGRQVGLIEDFGYQMTIAVIALSMLVSPTWIACASIFRGEHLAVAGALPQE